MNAFGLEFNDRNFEQTFKEIRFWGIPICILLSLFGTVKSEDKRSDRIAKTVLTFGAAIFAFFFMIMSIFADMCDWTNRETLFISKEDNNIKIIRRDYGCGATDSGPPIVKNFKVKESFKYFISATEVNIEEVDESKWIKVE